MVVKRDGREEPFDEKKLQRSIRACTEKLVVSEEQIVNLAQDVEDALNLRASNTRKSRAPP